MYHKLSVKLHVAYRNTRGITLVAALLLIVFVSVTVFGVSIFVVESLSQNSIKQAQLKTVDLAEAGLHHAVYFFRFRDLSGNGYFTAGQTNLDANNFFILTANMGDLLMVNRATAAIGGGNRDLLNLRIQNATNSQTITIDRMIVTWNNNRRLNQIRINGSNVWTGNLASPANANITNFTLNTTPTIYNVNRLRFSGSMAGATISVQFIMTDGSTRALTVFPASNANNFIVNSRGRISNSNINRLIRAEYNAQTGRIVDYEQQ